MATRSTITARFSNGIYRSLYCHYDGYLEGVGATLKANYNTEEKLLELFNMCWLRSLGNTIEECDELSYGEVALEGTCLEDVAIDAGQEFEYFWVDGVWYYSSEEAEGVEVP